jgi:hypothetical protein
MRNAAPEEAGDGDASWTERAGMEIMSDETAWIAVPVTCIHRQCWGASAGISSCRRNNPSANNGKSFEQGSTNLPRPVLIEMKTLSKTLNKGE